MKAKHNNPNKISTMTKVISQVSRLFSIKSSMLPNFSADVTGPVTIHPPVFRRASLGEGDKYFLDNIYAGPVTLSQLSLLSSDVRSMVETDASLLREYRRLQIHVAVLLRLGCCDYSRLITLGSVVSSIPSELVFPKLDRLIAKHIDKVIKLSQWRGCNCGITAFQKYANLYTEWWQTAKALHDDDLLPHLLDDMNQYVDVLQHGNACRLSRHNLELSSKIDKEDSFKKNASMKERAANWSGKILGFSRPTIGI